LSEDTVVNRSVIISGKVQGVFFRSTMKSIADEAGIKGWVRNTSDGKVEALLQGKAESVKRVIEWCNTGPERARVDSVKVKEEEVLESFRNFAILH
jgi:acylphosphatase